MAFMPVSEVHVIFKTHLDLGFTSLAKDIRQKYFEHYIPQAIEVARQMRGLNNGFRFVWTTGSWLIYEYLEWASSRNRIKMEKAIASGDIAWHALPFTMHSELLDASLFHFGLSLSRMLDKRFGRRTIAAKMTDVPGHTAAIVPLLSDAGVKFLHIGINPASAPPDVPDIFRWQQGNSEVLVAYDKTGYGQILKVPQIKSALAFAHTGDNRGPQSADTIIDAFTKMQNSFPGAHVHGSTLDEFAVGLLKKRLCFPAISGEIGDTWIHGAGTDPFKIARFRTLSRLRREWLEKHKIKNNENWFIRFSQHLLCIPEHTWGMDEKTFLDDYTQYDYAGLEALRRTAKCRLFESSWQEQSQYIEQAIKKIKPAVYKNEAVKCVKMYDPIQPDFHLFSKISDPAKVNKLEYFQIAFDPVKGTINHLSSNATNRLWFSRHNHLGLVKYELFNHLDYKRFGKQYIRNWPNSYDWAIKDFTKPGIEKINYKRGAWEPSACGFYMREDHQGMAFLVKMKMPASIVKAFGCPAFFTCEYLFLRSKPVIHISLQWFKKRACRLPEATWFSFCPRIDQKGSWYFDKLGTRISPVEVIKNGNCHLHAVGEGISYTDKKGKLVIRSLDAPLVAPGMPSLLNFNNKLPALSKGMHFNLHNNVWGTNFPMWFEKDARFRFEIDFS